MWGATMGDRNVNRPDDFTLHVSDVPGVVDLRCDACNGVVRRFAVNTSLSRVNLRAEQHECRARRNIAPQRVGRTDVTNTAQVQCPECGQLLPVEFHVEIGDVDATGDLQAEAVPDLSEVWSHAWSHE